MKKQSRVSVIFILILVFIWLFLLTGYTIMSDPTRPPGIGLSSDTAVVGKTLELTAVFIYPNYRIAIINNQLVMIGDHVGEYIVTAIMPFTVELIGPDNNKESLQLVTSVKQEK